MTTARTPRRDVDALARALEQGKARTRYVEEPVVPVDADPRQLAGMLEEAATGLTMADRPTPAPATLAALLSAAAAVIRTGLVTTPSSALAAVVDTIPTARATDPATSRNAAPKPPRRGTQAARLLEAFVDEWEPRPGFPTGGAGLTSEEAAELAEGVSLRSEYAKRCSDLAALGLIDDTGVTRAGASGHQRIVWAPTPAGRQLVAALRDEPS